MINAHPMVVGSFASNPSSVRVRKQEQNHYNAGFSATETVIDKEDAIRGSNNLAIAIRSLFIASGVGDQSQHLACIAVHQDNLETLPKRDRAA